MKKQRKPQSVSYSQQFCRRLSRLRGGLVMHRLIASFVVCVFFMAASASAGTLRLDFGDADADAYDGIDDPAHFEGTVSPSYTAWQVISDVDFQIVPDSDSNLMLVNMDRNADSSGDDIDLDREPVAKSEGGSTSLTHSSFVFNTKSSTTYREPLGVVISGLPTGDHCVYVVAHFGYEDQVDFNVLADTTTASVNPGSDGTDDITDVYGFANSDTLEGLDGGGFGSWVMGLGRELRAFRDFADCRFAEPGRRCRSG